MNYGNRYKSYNLRHKNENLHEFQNDPSGQGGTRKGIMNEIVKPATSVREKWEEKTQQTRTSTTRVKNADGYWQRGRYENWQRDKGPNSDTWSLGPTARRRLRRTLKPRGFHRLASFLIRRLRKLRKLTSKETHQIRIEREGRNERKVIIQIC